MRRGLAGVRLCDRAGCAYRWPCAVHGTASVGDYEHLGRHAGSFGLSTGGDVLDVTSCGACGFALCCCPSGRANDAAKPEPACEVCGGTREQDGICRPSDPCWDHDFKPATALRPGWTTDGEGYFNDAIALMVCPTDDGEKWRVYGNGAPWPNGYEVPAPGSPDEPGWVLAEHAMKWAECFARNGGDAFRTLAEALAQ